jgi:low temperature requirement protein LtrA
MKLFFSYWFWPNPAGWHYQDTKVQLVLLGCLVMVLGYFAIRFWRSKLRNPITRSLSASWARASMVFGVVAAVLVVSRVETIQFVSMRAMWAVWLLCLALYILIQLLNFRRRHYVIVEKQHVVDERDKYLPKKKK